MIIPADARAIESEMALAIEACCRTRAYGEGQMKELMFELPRFIKLSGADKERQGPREEMKWVAVLRNVGRTITKDPSAFGGKLLYLKGGIFGVAEIAEERRLKKLAREVTVCPT